jgi:hypothetical protein
VALMSGPAGAAQSMKQPLSYESRHCCSCCCGAIAFAHACRCS